MRYRWLVVAAFLALLVAGVVGKRAYNSRQRAAAQLAEWRQEQAFEQRLSKPVALQFGKSIRSRDWLAEWSQQSGLLVQCHYEDKFAEQMHQHLQLWLDLPSLPASVALQAFCERENAHWWLAADGKVQVFFAQDSSWPDSVPRELGQYTLSPRLRAAGEDALADLLVQSVERDSWEDVGGSGTCEFTGGQLFVVQHRGIKDQVAGFLSALESMLEQSAQLPAAGLLPDDARLVPKPLCAGSLQLSLLMERLRRPVTLNLVALTLPQFAEQISEQLGFPVLIDRREFITNTNKPVITCQVQGIQLRHALQLALDDHALAVVPYARGRALQITYDHRSRDDRHKTTWAYPVGDLIFHPDRRTSFDPLIETITSIVQPDSESGAGSVHGLEHLLTAKVTWQKHLEIQELLTAIRRVRCGIFGPQARAGFDSAASQRLLAAYETPRELSYANQTLAAVVTNLRERCELPIYWSNWCQDAGITPEHRITCHLPVRCLRENLDALLQPLGLEVQMEPEYLLITAPFHRYSSGRVTEICDIRPLQRSGAEGKRRQEFLQSVFNQGWGQVRSNDASLPEFDGLLLMRQTPQTVERIAQVIHLLRDALSTTAPHWPGRGKLTGEAANRPLSLNPLINEARQQALEAKLQQRDALQFDFQPMRDILLAIAKKHLLPVVPIGIPSSGIPLDAQISFRADDQSLSEILQNLVGQPEVVRWRAENGFLHINTDALTKPGINPDGTAGEYHRQTYFIGDLLKSRGSVSRDELRDRLETILSQPAGNNDALHFAVEAEIHFDCLLTVYCTPQQQLEVEKILRTLRAILQEAEE